MRAHILCQMYCQSPSPFRAKGQDDAMWRLSSLPCGPPCSRTRSEICDGCACQSRRSEGENPSKARAESYLDAAYLSLITVTSLNARITIFFWCASRLVQIRLLQVFRIIYHLYFIFLSIKNDNFNLKWHTQSNLCRVTLLSLNSLCMCPSLANESWIPNLQWMARCKICT